MHVSRLPFEIRQYWRSRWRSWLWALGLWPDVRLSPSGRIEIAGSVARRPLWLDIIRQDPCAYCGQPGESLDHVVPQSGGGGGGLNLTHACYACNRTKGAQSLLGYLVARRRPPIPAIVVRLRVPRLRPAKPLTFSLRPQLEAALVPWTTSETYVVEDPSVRVSPEQVRAVADALSARIEEQLFTADYPKAQARTRQDVGGVVSGWASC
jgi:hypothetical protein